MATRGFDGHKKIKGRKRHIVVDTLGFPLVVKVHDANLSDSKQAIAIMETLFFWFSNIKMIWQAAIEENLLLSMVFLSM